jgi:hypothetical protein
MERGDWANVLRPGERTTPAVHYGLPADKGPLSEGEAREEWQRGYDDETKGRK